MKLTYDADHDVAYLDLAVGTRGIATITQQHALVPGSNVLIDVDMDGRVIGIEFLEASKQLRMEELQWWQ